MYIPSVSGKAGSVAILLLGLAVGVAGLPCPGAPAPPGPPSVRLTNPVDVAAKGVEVDRATLLPDNETVVVVGGKPRPPKDPDWVNSEAPPAGALVNVRTKTARPFTNGHTDRINSVAGSADGSRIFTVSRTKEPFVRVWDVKGGKSLAPVPLPKSEQHFGSYKVASFRGSRKVAVLCSHEEKDSVVLLDPAGREKPVDLTADSLSGPLTISPDDRLVACTILEHRTVNKVVVWEVQSKKVVYSVNLLPKGENPADWSIYALGFTRDSTKLIALRCGPDAGEVPKGMAEEKVAAERRALCLIDIGKRQVTPLGMGNQIRTTSFALHPSGDWIATAGLSRPDKAKAKGRPDDISELRIYHLPSRSLAFRAQFDDEEFGPGRVWFTSDGKKLIALDGAEGKVRAWDFVVGKR